jgi:hypothetical protein
MLAIIRDPVGHFVKVPAKNIGRDISKIRDNISWVRFHSLGWRPAVSAAPLALLTQSRSIPFHKILSPHGIPRECAAFQWVNGALPSRDVYLIPRKPSAPLPVLEREYLFSAKGAAFISSSPRREF